MILYIAGYGRSGSTLLDIILSNAKDGFTLGEISNIFNEKIKVTDPFYADIFFRTCAELNLSDSEIKKIEMSDKLFHDYSSKYGSFWNHFLKNIKEKQEVEYFIDSSKTTWHTFLRPYHLAKSGFDVRIIFLKASYKKVWLSALKGSNKSLTSNNAPIKKNYVFAFRTLISKFLIDLLTSLYYIKNKNKYCKLSYEDLIADPLKTIQLISKEIEVNFIDLDDKIKRNEFLIKGGYLGNRLRKQGAYIKIKTAN
ncbi:hypothetical protein [Aequorivita sp. Q41]|uniref:hypothetical protein n=1 Tax=Aequorivita sp. Q41 TaxID=3153300 RepID=UPI003241DBB2